MSDRGFYKNILRPLSTKRLFKYDFVGFDVETHGDNNDFLMGGLYYYIGDNNYQPIYKAFYDREEMIKYLLGHRFKGKYVTATNLDFDLTKLFLGTKYWNELKRIERGGQLLYAEHKSHNYKKKGKLRFIDTTNFVFWSVEKLGSILGVPKLEKPSTWKRVKNKETGEDDYEITPPTTFKEKKELENYNMYDCKISCDFMYFLQKGFNKAGGKLKITMASTSFDVWRRGFLKDLMIKEQFVLNDYDINDFIFKGYYGGRTEAYKNGSFKDVYYYDINSLYPSVMRDYKYPFPNSVKKPYKNDVNNILRYEGVSTVHVKSPRHLDKPFLPVRLKGKLCFPLGSFKGTYNHCEIRKAISLGYTIGHVEEQLIYTKTFDPFSDFVNHFYNARKEQKQNNDPMELISKLILNTLYGKFGQRKITHTSIKKISDIGTYEELQSMLNDGDVKDGYIMTSKEAKFNGKNSYPIIASYVTSYSRIRMYDYIKHKDVIYTDTDSIITTKNLGIDHKELGKMKLEGKYNNCDVIKPKMYMLENKEETIVKAKGIKKANKKDYEDILNGKSVKKLKLAKLRESLRRGFNPYQKMIVEKEVNLVDNKREWKHGESTPLKVRYYVDFNQNYTEEDYQNEVDKLEKQTELETRREVEYKVSEHIKHNKYKYHLKNKDLKLGLNYCYTNNIDPDNIDFNSYSDDTSIIDYIMNEYEEVLI